VSRTARAAVAKSTPDTGTTGAPALLHKQASQGSGWLVCADRKVRQPVPLTMYTTQWCGFCKRLKAQLSRVGVEMTEVDIEHDPAAAEFVMSVNGGNQTVPTLLFPDGSTMVNPSAAQVQARLAEVAAAQAG
jgi:mycoredoxin